MCVKHANGKINKMKKKKKSNRGGKEEMRVHFMSESQRKNKNKILVYKEYFVFHIPSAHLCAVDAAEDTFAGTKI